MKILYIKMYNIKYNVKKYIYKSIKSIYKIYNIIKKKINIANLKNKLNRINNIKTRYFFQDEERKILKFIIYYNLKNKNTFNIFKNNNIKLYFFLYKIIKLKSKKILKIIKKYSTNWTIDRINPINLIILNIAIAEYFFLRKKNKKYIPIIVDESINISNLYSSYKSKYYINGILDKIFNEIKIV